MQNFAYAQRFQASGGGALDASARFAGSNRGPDAPPPDGELRTVTVGGMAIASVTRRALAARMSQDCRAAAEGRLRSPRVVISSNGSVIARYHRDVEFRSLIDQADIVDADGAPLIMASRLLCRAPLPERIATTDFIHDCCEEAARHRLRFFFLGGRPGVAQRAAQNLRRAHASLQVAGCRDGFFRPEDAPDVCRQIVESGANVLWLGLGSPNQERFAIEHRHRLSGLGWIHTCGGLFDHMAGSVKRAPRWMQRAGLEWLYRVMQEPQRLTARYATTNLPAAYHLLTKTQQTAR